MGSLVVFKITPLLRSLENSVSIISVSTGEKLKGDIADTLVFQQIPLLNQTLLYLNKLILCNIYNCVICPFFKIVCYVTALEFLHVCP